SDKRFRRERIIGSERQPRLWQRTALSDRRRAPLVYTDSPDGPLQNERRQAVLTCRLLAHPCSRSRLWRQRRSTVAPESEHPAIHVGNRHHLRDVPPEHVDREGRKATIATSVEPTRALF